MTQIETVIDDLEKATNAALALCKQLAAARGDADEWHRLPSPAKRCSISGFSRSKIVRLIDSNEIRGKHVGSSRFYAGADVRKLISKP